MRIKLVAANQSFGRAPKGKFRQGRQWPVMAGKVRSPTVTSEHPNSQNPGLADWPLSGNRYGRFGTLLPLADSASQVVLLIAFRAAALPDRPQI